MMSLQSLALEKLVESGAPIDWDDPHIKNVLFDVRSTMLDLDHQIDQEYARLERLRSRLNFKMDVPSMETYTEIRMAIEDMVFDNFVATEPQHAPWSEYFHALYDLVVVARFDRTTTLLLLVELGKYYTVLKKPPDLEPNDKLYPLVAHILSLFRDLQAEHEKIRPVDLAGHLQRFTDFQVATRLEYQAARKGYDELRARRERYSRITFSSLQV